jgi:GNAT superfamily N-acetyltransferase
VLSRWFDPWTVGPLGGRSKIGGRPGVDVTVAFRRANPEEAGTLQALARESKAHWGYPPTYMRVWNYDAKATADFIAAHDVYCAEIDRALAGFYALSPEAEVARIVHFWVAPMFIGRGVGKALFEHAATRAAANSATALIVTAEPHSATFYEHMGARCIGEEHDPRLEQTFPVFRYPLVERISGG